MARGENMKGRPKKKECDLKRSTLMRVGAGFHKKTKQIAIKNGIKPIDVTRKLEENLDSLFNVDPLAKLRLFRK